MKVGKKIKKDFLKRLRLWIVIFVPHLHTIVLPKKYKIFYIPNPADISFETLKML